MQPIFSNTPALETTTSGFSRECESISHGHVSTIQESEDADDLGQESSNQLNIYTHRMVYTAHYYELVWNFVGLFFGRFVFLPRVPSFLIC